jgi:hypothetical protein
VWDFKPVRSPHLHVRRRTMTGWFSFRSSRQMVVFESVTEREVLLGLDYERAIVAVAGQPFAISTRNGTYIPDFAALRRDGQLRIIEVKEDDEAAVVEAESALSRQLSDLVAPIGWRYEIRAPAPPTVRANLRWLRAARPDPREFDELAPRVLTTARTPRPLGALVGLADPAVSRPVVGRLLWEQRIVAPLDRPLTDATVAVARR